LMRCHWDRHLVVLPGGVVALFTCQRRRLAAPSVRCACGYHLLMAQASVSRSWCLLSPGDPDAAPGASDFNASGIGMVGMERSELPAVTNFHIKQPRRGHVNHCVEGGTVEQHKESLQRIIIWSLLGAGTEDRLPVTEILQELWRLEHAGYGRCVIRCAGLAGSRRPCPEHAPPRCLCSTHFADSLSTSRRQKNAKLQCMGTDNTEQRAGLNHSQ